MTQLSNKGLFEALIQGDVLPKDAIDSALKAVEATDESLDSYLIRNGLLTKQQILAALEKRFSMETVDLKRLTIDTDVIEKIPVKIAWYYKFMPIRIDNKVLTVTAPAPLDVKIQDEIRLHLGYEPRVVLSTETDILDALKKHYGLAADMIDRILTKEPVRKEAFAGVNTRWVEDLEQKSDDASVSKLVNQIILEAYKKRATDIHIEPYREKVRFRYRIDGALVDANLPNDIKHFILPILSRIKIMSNLSIVEKRVPQDGSAVVKVQDQTLDLRVSTIPTPQGESMVIRILPTKVMTFRLEKLGLDKKNIEVFRKLIGKPHGVIFVTGPTGSGKTTTLYACLHEVNSAERKIITIEDPVEYEMEDVTQIQVNPKIGLSFAAGLRSVLRHDPDIIMVGEVRDLETAEIAIRTALTGHLVFSTLHTNDAASGITRLIEMNVEPYLISSSIEAFVAQRLVRVVCKNCKEEVECPPEIKKEILHSLDLNESEIVKVYQGRGCDRCNGTGYYGRTAIYEILLMDDEIRAAMLEKLRSDYIKKIAKKNGMLTLRQDGWLKVLRGITTPYEVLNVTGRDDDELQESSRAISEIPIELMSYQASDSQGREYKVISKDTLSEKKEFDARTYMRIDEQVDVQFRLFRSDPDALAVQAESLQYSTHTENIGAGGVRLISDYPLPIGSIIEIKIFLNETNQKIVECLAKVSRVDKNKDKRHYDLVAYYLDISSADRARIDNWVKERNSKKNNIKE